MTYVNLGISVRKEIQKQYIDHTQSMMKSDRKLGDLIDWENRDDILTWLDRL